MKFTLFVFIVGFSCFLAASINNNLPPASLNTELDYNDEIVENNVARISIPWDALGDIIRKLLSSWKGLKCISNEISIINDATMKFVKDIQECTDGPTETTTDSSNESTNDSSVASSTTENLNATAHNIISKANEILQFSKELYYDSRNKNKEMDSEILPQYFSELYNKNIALKKEIFDIVAAIEAACKLGVCAAKATKGVHDVLIEFPTNIEKCLQNKV